MRIIDGEPVFDCDVCDDTLYISEFYNAKDTDDIVCRYCSKVVGKMSELPEHIREKIERL